jgi:hypothetical protein
VPEERKVEAEQMVLAVVAVQLRVQEVRVHPDIMVEMVIKKIQTWAVAVEGWVEQVGLVFHGLMEAMVA